MSDTSDAEQLRYAKRYLKRTKSLAELKSLADTVFTSSTETVTLTSNSYEGGAASGQVTFRKDILGQAIEDLIQELDPTVVPPVARQVMSWADRGCQQTRL